MQRDNIDRACRVTVSLAHRSGLRRPPSSFSHGPLLSVPPPPGLCPSPTHRLQVTLVLGATGCGKTTQVPQLLLEDCVARRQPCRVLATQPRRISAVSVADRVAKERGGRVGDSVASKVRFEDSVTPTSRVVFCTVGIVLRVMQSNPDLDGATHVVIDEVCGVECVTCMRTTCQIMGGGGWMGTADNHRSPPPPRPPQANRAHHQGLVPPPPPPPQSGCPQ